MVSDSGPRSVSTAASTADGRRSALASFLLHQPRLLLPVAAGVRERATDFESAIHGSSMAPAIPAGARLRVCLLTQGQACHPGDVVFYLTGDRYMVHRVAYRQGRGRAGGYLLTWGDGRLAPDPPVPSDQVLGLVTAVVTPEGERPPGPAVVPGPSYKRAIRAITLAVAIAALRINPWVAARVAGVLLGIEAGARAMRRSLHRRA
jgi:hypothetical protein